MARNPMLWHLRNIRRTFANQWRSPFNLHPTFAGGAIIGTVLILAVVGVATHWWSSIPHQPERPSVVPKDAVWIAESKSGQWILCQAKEHGDKAQCTIWGQSGTLDYEGDFRTYKGSTLSPGKRLDIDTRITGEPCVFIHNIFVPVIYLKDHKSLIPAEAYSMVIEKYKNSLW
jgi:hypothetical protein